MEHLCPVCGYPGLREPPRSATGGASYEICPSCGFEFGVSDDDGGFSYEQWRENWKQRGMQWKSCSFAPPSRWNPARQLAKLPPANPPPAARSQKQPASQKRRAR